MKDSLQTSRGAAVLISALLVFGTLLPTQARAGILSDLLVSITGAERAEADTVYASSLQTMSLPRPAMNANPMAGKGGGDIKIVDDNALMPEEGPSGTIADIEKPKDTISVYTVHPGDTLSGIAKLFNVTPNTILWANDLPQGAKLQVGQVLTILPVPGVKYVVKKGDTLASVAKRFSGDEMEIASYNGIADGTLEVGMEIIIPDGEIQAPPPPKPKKGTIAVGAKGTATQIGFYATPLSRYTRTQGIHGYNGVDLAAPAGTPILASAAGEVIIAKNSGWNGGYGKYVVIQHSNGSQTLYSHAATVSVSVGQTVSRGEAIGSVGSSGKSTGPHLHFEIRNGVRNPF